MNSKLTNQETKRSLGSRGEENGTVSARIFSPGPKYLHSDLHIICISFASSYKACLLFKAKVDFQNVPLSPVLPHPVYSGIGWKCLDFQGTRVVPGSHTFCVSNAACHYAFYCHKTSWTAEETRTELPGRLQAICRGANSAELERGELAR